MLEDPAADWTRVVGTSREFATSFSETLTAENCAAALALVPFVVPQSQAFYESTSLSSEVLIAPFALGCHISTLLRDPLAVWTVPWSNLLSVRKRAFDVLAGELESFDWTVNPKLK